VAPTYSEATQKLLSQHALGYLSAIICNLLDMEDWASQQLGYSCLEEVPWQDVHNERVLCDKCATSIANFHMSCSCGWDVCVKCLRESWVAWQQGQEQTDEAAASRGSYRGGERSCHSRAWPCCLNPSCDYSPATCRKKETWPLKVSLKMCW
jgi:hypothetical protein